jgi:predicted RNase H-like HicB family nuclease
MRRFVAIVERCPDTGLYVGWVPGVPGAHSQGESLDELHRNLQEVLQMLQQDCEIEVSSEFVGMQVITVT